MILYRLILHSAAFLLCFLLTACETKTLTLEQAKGKKFPARVENVDFDVPLLFQPIESEKQKERWAAPPLKRTTIDAIRIKALLSDMDQYNEKTANDFKVRGWGKTIHIMMTHYRVNWPYYFEGAYKRLIKLPENPLLPGMFHFRDPDYDSEDVYMSQDSPDRKLI